MIKNKAKMFTYVDNCDVILKFAILCCDISPFKCVDITKYVERKAVEFCPYAILVFMELKKRDDTDEKRGTCTDTCQDDTHSVIFDSTQLKILFKVFVVDHANTMVSYA